MYKIILKGYKTNTILNNFLNACNVLDGEVLEKSKLVIKTQTVPTQEYIQGLIEHVEKTDISGYMFKNMTCISAIKEG